MSKVFTENELVDVLLALNDSCDQSKANGEKDFYWRCGNANAVNYIAYKMGITLND